MLKAKKILIFQQRGWAINIGHFLAKRLQDEGAVLGALTIKKTTHEFVVNQSEVNYALIVCADAIKENPGEFLGDDEFSLEEICSELGIDTIWELVQAARNHVKSYEDKFYFGFKQNVSDEEIIVYVKAIYKNIKNIFEVFNPDLIIAPNFVALQHIMFNLYATKRNVPMTGVTDSKIRGNTIFINDYMSKSGAFFERLEELRNGEESPNSARAKEYIINSKEKLLIPLDYSEPSNEGFLAERRQDLQLLKRCAVYYIKGAKNKLNNLGATLDNLSPKYLVRDHFAKRKYIRFSNNFNYYSLDKCEKFIYFPLQFQPEETIDVKAPRFNNQLETARQVAMSLPGSYTLVVKDHPAMKQYRTPGFLEKISRLPNVKLVSNKVASETVLKRCEMVISPSSTTIAEAAFVNKPAIQLGNLGTTLQFPSTFSHSNLLTLSTKIIEVLKKDLNTPQFQKELEVYVEAAFDTGFDWDYFGVWEQNKKEDMEPLWMLYKNEVIRLLGRNQ